MDYEKHINKIKKTRKQEAINIAMDMFLESTIDDVKMTDIAEKSQIGVASLYRYFGTKEAIVLDVGTQLWDKLMESILEGFDVDNYNKSTGIVQVEQLLELYKKLYLEHGKYVKFIANFDAFCLKENISKAKLEEYEKSILSISKIFQTAYDKGVKDNTIKSGFNAKTLYLSVSRTLMALIGKLIQGEILSSDDFSGTNELQLIIDMTLAYIKTT